MKYLYLTLSILGTIIPYIPFLKWIHENPIVFENIFNAIVINKLSIFAWLDIFISGIVLILFILQERKKIPTRLILFNILGTLTIGVSFGLPFLLYLKEKYK